MTCNELQEDLALTAADASDTRRRALVREHVDQCPECAARLREYELICSAHSRIAGELDELWIGNNIKPVTRARSLTAPSYLWRWLLPIAGAGAAAALILLMRPPVPQRAASPAQAEASAQPARRASATGTLARYRQALDRPGEGSLDSLLARDADAFLRAPSRSELLQLRNEVF
jgi:anti-sigma factor RsiW